MFRLFNEKNVVSHTVIRPADRVAGCNERRGHAPEREKQALETKPADGSFIRRETQIGTTILEAEGRNPIIFFSGRMDVFSLPPPCPAFHAE
jgi:hypothetical protein